MLIRNALLDGRLVDLRLDGDRIAEIGPDLRGEELLDAAGAQILPGLVDHHLHLHALAAAAASVDLTGLTRPQMAAALAAAPTDEHGWVRAVGLADDLDAAALDALHPHRPVRAQHRSGAQWTVNSTGARLLNLTAAGHPGVERDAAGAPTGRLRRADDWLRTRLPVRGVPDLTDVGRRLAAHGITAVTDATPDLVEFDANALPQRVTLLGVGLECAAPLGTTVGPYKIVLADPDLPDLEDLTARITAAHGTGRAVAVHCVTREAFALLLAALDAAGSRPGDRIEHAALVPAAAISALRDRGLRVVTQPGFLGARGDDYRRDVPAADHADLYRCASLHRAGVPLALSSDAPHGPLDPWAVIAGATTRLTPDGEPLNPAECLTESEALAAYLASPDDPGGAPRTVAVDAPADLVLRQDGATRATLVAGHLVHP
ncbi:amidohydrolase family protein [Sporichthya brevicatena]|uniref:Amidohydrolase family protein n=1 Tax=Sporichthya brevicatena TaxID=171442 RepID=A0ABN1GRU5_9ACTN